MAQYLVKVKSFINNAIREAGAIIEYAGHAHPSNLEPVEGEKAAAVVGPKDDKADLERQKSAAQNGVDLNAVSLLTNK